MVTVLISVVGLVVLFVGFGLMNRGKEESRRCGSCPTSENLREALDNASEKRS